MPLRKSRRPIARRRSSKSTLQIKVETHVMREIWAVTDMALCILTVLSIQGRLGVIGHLWNSFLTPIFGWGLYAVPVFLGGISLALFFARQIRFDATRIFGLILLSISVLGTLHLAVPEDQIYEVARVGQYGGGIGVGSRFFFGPNFGGN